MRIQSRRKNRFVGRLFAAALVMFGGSTEAGTVYRFKLTYGSDPICKAYVDRLVRTRFQSPPICRSDEIAISKGFDSLRAVAVPPEDVGRIAPQVDKVLSGADLPKSFIAPSNQANADTSYAVHPAAQNQSRAILSGQPLKYYAQFNPPVDVDNDGIGDDIVIWKDSFVPCGNEYPHAATEVMITPIYLLVMDSRRNIDGERTRNLFGNEMQEAVARARGRAVTIPPGRRSKLKLLGESYGIVKFDGLYYTDAYFYKTSSAGEIEPNLWRIGVFVKHAKETKLVCEIEETRTST